MTTDNFTEAVHDAGDGRYTTPGLRGVFAEGAYWARAHLAAQEPTDAEVEAAFWAFTREHFGQAYSRERGDQGLSSRQSMRAALSAARAARRDEDQR